MKAFFLYSIILSICLISSLSLSYGFQNPNGSLFIKRLFPFVETTLLGIFFFFSFVSKKRIFIIPLSLLIISSAYLIDLFALTKKPYFLPLTVECLYFVFLIILYFYERMMHINELPISSLPVFWISVGFLIGFSGTFFLFLFSIFLIKDNNFKNTYHVVYGSFTILKNLLIIIGIYVNHKNEINKMEKNKPIEVDLGTFTPYSDKTILNLL